MRLVNVEIEAYRSILKPISLHLDPVVTVILGANDHGKTNLLHALRHLNTDNPFKAERDLNWDRVEKPEEFPSMVFNFELDEEDRGHLLKLATPQLSEGFVNEEGTVGQGETEEVTENDNDLEKPPPNDSTSAEDTLTLDDIPTTVRLVRAGAKGKGVRSGPTFSNLQGIDSTVVKEFLLTHIPRIELITAQDKVPDSVSAEELQSEEHEFMRGIFYYAGLDPKNCQDLFEQNDRTMRQLQNASRELNRKLKMDWSQGEDLSFRLVHESQTKEIILRIDDPAVEGRLVRASQRSNGFTHFFTLKTVLYARQREHPANSYIFLFDEPGVFLHPTGQHDLLQVLDTIGKSNQVVYATHSIFMLNKTFPARHRLLEKTKQGTELDEKPYVGRWGPAIEALGLSLAGTILFAQHVLLSEGDSDPILISCVLQKLVSLGKVNVDLNTFSIISTGTSRNADALIRILLEGAASPRLAVLVDGDPGGDNRLNALAPLLTKEEIPSKRLIDGTTVEDHLPLAGELYRQAVADYVIKLMVDAGKSPDDTEKAHKDFKKSFIEKFEDETKVTSGIVAWAMEESQKLGDLAQPPSKIGIAREYARILEETPDDKFTGAAIARSIKLAEWIQQELAVPKLREAAPEILLEESS